MIKNPEFDDIRPYYDDEVASVIERLLKNPQFRQIMHFLFPEEKVKEIEQLMQTFTNQHDFQHQLMAKLVWDLLNRTDSVVTSAGFENVSPETAYTFISNHRDIVLDASILSILLAGNGFETMEIAIGDNLLLTDWIKDLVRLNRSFIVKRNLPMRQMLEASKLLSKYIHFTIKDKKQSIWIAQREGRAKDSNDRTQDSVLKMLAMGSEQHFLKSMTELNLTPLTFSYEYDPCDYLKAKEFQQRIDITGFKKTQEDDLLNMRTGIFGYKGRIHLQVGHTINPALLNLDDSLNRNELATKTASIIDNEIFRNYKFFPVNYIAYDRLWGNNFFCEKYTPEDVKNYERYFQQQLDKIDLPNKNIPYLTGKMEEMYANPVRNQLGIEN
jgi:hypothetical protein